MSEGKKRREWIKNVAIIFLAALLVLTFFSGTIQNYYLPEVAVQYTTSDSVSSGIRASGTVNAEKTYSIVAEGTRTVESVLIRNGDEVSAGDVILTLEDTESEELAAAREELKRLQNDYERALLGQSSSSTTSLEQAVSNAEIAYSRAVADRNNFEAALASSAQKRAVDDAQRALTALETWHDGKGQIDVDEKAAIASFAAYVGVESTDDLFEPTEVKTSVPMTDADGTPLAQDGTPLKPDPENEGEWLGEQGVEEIITYTVTSYAFANVKKGYQPLYTAAHSIAKAELVSAQTALQEVRNGYTDAVTAAQQNLVNAQQLLEEAKKNNAASSKLEDMDMLAMKEAIARQQETVAGLETDATDAVITAKQAGTVSGLMIAAGEKLMDGETVCVVQLTDTAYTVDISLPQEEAKKVRVGTSATVSGYWWGETPRATVTSIRSDTVQRGNRIVTLTLTGSVEAGSSFNFVLAESSNTYDIVVPKSAVHQDNTGDFVFTVINKNTPLGTRYHVVRTDVEVLAQDDTRCAVLGDFTGWDYVVTSSSAPLSSGDQVRMANS